MTTVWIYLLLTFIISFWSFYMLPIKYRWILLLIASICFYIFAAGWQAFFGALFAITMSFFGAIFIDKNKSNRKIQQTILATVVLLIIIEFVILTFSDVYNGLAHIIKKLFSIDFNIANLVAPIGMSFYSLILIAYVTDVYRNIATVQKNFFKYSLFGLYFPTIMMGPILRYNDIKDSLYSQKEVDYNCIKFGIVRILWGIIKKIVIADRIALIINPVFGNIQTYSGEELLFFMFLFAWQFYVDFSAVYDIVLGISECFGIILPENFHNPFFARNFHDFWNRWHITLYSFYKDYIFYPVMRSKFVLKIKTIIEKTSNKWLLKYIPLFISYFVVWSLASFRHGFSKGIFINIGMIPFLLFVFEDILSSFFKHNKSTTKSLIKTIFSKVGSLIYVTCFLFFNWSFFKTRSLETGVILLKKIFTNSHISDFSISNLDINTEEIYIILSGILILLIVDILKEVDIDLRKKYTELHFIVRLCIIFILLVIIFLLGLYGTEYNPQDFIYFKS